MGSYGTFLAAEVEMQMNNADPVKGRDAILAGLSEYWKSFASVEHDLRNLYGTDQSFVLEALNHDQRHDGKQVTLRAVAFTDRDEDGLVTSVRLDTDTAPLFA